MRKKILLSVMAGALMLMFLPLAQAAEEVEEIPDVEAGWHGDDSDADGWFSTTDETAGITGRRKENKAHQEDGERYFWFLDDNSYSYYMDTQSAKWIRCPYRIDEYIIDVWIRLQKEHVAEEDGEEQSSPGKYYLEHYYVRPDKQQIQFLCELEVTGRPNNTIRQRSYSSANWEPLVPGSVEDEIYKAVVEKMKKLGGRGKPRPGFNDVVEDIFRISI